VITAIIISIIFFLVGGILIQGMKKIPAKPPHKAQITKFGERIPGKFKNEGWRFFLFYPYWHGFILVKVERVPLTITVEKARTPDGAESKIPVLLTYRAAEKFLVNYLNSGGEEGVNKQLTGKVQERVREWCMGDEEGPQTWIELNKSKLEGTSVLIKKIASNSIAEIPIYAQDVPTWIWLRYYSKPRPKKFQKIEEDWVKDDWAKVKEILNSFTQKQKDDLEESLKKRNEQIESLRTGSGTILIIDLGIILERLNIGDIDVLGEVAKKAETEAKEEEERKGEALELKFVLDRIAECMAPPFNYSKEQALEIIQVERGKVPKEIKENKLTFSSETLSFLENSLSLIGKNLMEGWMKGGK